MAEDSSLEFSFSGIKTQVAVYLETHGLPATEQGMNDLCASFQRAVTGVLSAKLIRAAEREAVGTVVLGGGVAANRELRERVCSLSKERGLRAVCPPIANCTDNAAMIAYAGSTRLLSGERDGWDLNATSATALHRETRKGRGKRAG